MKIATKKLEQLSESENSDEEEQSSAKCNGLKNVNSSSDSSSDSEEAPILPSHPVETKSPSTSPRKNVLSLDPLERLSQKLGLSSVTLKEVISENDDVSVFDLPNNLNPNDFIGLHVKLHKRTRLKINNKKYVIEPFTDDVRPITLLSGNLKIIHPKVNFRLREYVKSKVQEEIVDVGKDAPVLPDNLKVRHPLFGAEYKNKIVLDEEIEKKLDKAIEQELKKMKKKKKHKKKEEEESDSWRKKQHVEEEQEQEEIFSLLDSHISEKKVPKVKEESISSQEDIRIKKKYKNSIKKLNEEFGGYNGLHEGNSDSNKKAKKKKHIKEDEEDNDLIKSLMSTSFEGLQNVESLRENEENVSFNEGKHKSKKDKKKHRIKEEITNFDLALPSFEGSLREKASQRSFEGEQADKKEKKRKKTHSIKEELEDTEFDKTMSFTESEHHGKKEKKKKEKNNVTQDNIDAEMSFERKSYQKKKMLQNCISAGNSSAEDREKKNKINIINSTVISGVQLPFFDFDMSDIMKRDEANLPLKKEATPQKHNSDSGSASPKKKKHSSEENNFESSVVKRSISEDESVQSSPKKKLKKVKEEKEETNFLIMDLLNKVKNEIDTSVKPKKKKKVES